MKFRTLSQCTGCGELLQGVNSLPTKDFVCPNCGNRYTLCPSCLRFGRECLVCEEKLVPEWEFSEKGPDRTRQRKIADYAYVGDTFGGF